jgi:hypothetical protein
MRREFWWRNHLVDRGDKRILNSPQPDTKPEAM